MTKEEAASAASAEVVQFAAERGVAFEPGDVQLIQLGALAGVDYVVRESARRATAKAAEAAAQSYAE